MARHPLGRRRLAAAAALAVLGLLLAFLGQASASHLNVEADGNLVWSSAWPDSPPDPPEPIAPTLTWADWFAGNEQTYLRNGSNTLEAHFAKADPWEEARNYSLYFVSTAGTAVLPGAKPDGTQRITDRNPSDPHSFFAVFADTNDLKNAFISGLPDAEAVHAFVLEIRRPDGSVAARSATFWWGWSGDFHAHTSVTQPLAWAPAN